MKAGRVSVRRLGQDHHGQRCETPEPQSRCPWIHALGYLTGISILEDRGIRGPKLRAMIGEDAYKLPGYHLSSSNLEKNDSMRKMEWVSLIYPSIPTRNETLHFSRRLHSTCVLHCANNTYYVGVRRDTEYPASMGVSVSTFISMGLARVGH